jgi:hypothetical protein
MNNYARRILFFLVFAMSLTQLHAEPKSKKKENKVVQFFKKNGSKIVVGLGAVGAAAIILYYKFLRTKSLYEQLSPQAKEQYRALQQDIRAGEVKKEPTTNAIRYQPQKAYNLIFEEIGVKAWKRTILQNRDEIRADLAAHSVTQQEWGIISSGEPLPNNNERIGTLRGCILERFNGRLRKQWMTELEKEFGPLPSVGDEVSDEEGDSSDSEPEKNDATSSPARRLFVIEQESLRDQLPWRLQLEFDNCKRQGRNIMNYPRLKDELYLILVQKYLQRERGSSPILQNMDTYGQLLAALATAPASEAQRMIAESKVNDSIKTGLMHEFEGYFKTELAEAGLPS